jgi:hypothetical protein
MLKESLPLLIALSLPLVGAVGLVPAGGMGQRPAAMKEPATLPVARPIELHLPAEVPPQPSIAGIWLNF